MLENVKNFVSEKMEKVEDFCEDYFGTIYVATVVGFSGIVAAACCMYLKNASKQFKDLN